MTPHERHILRTYGLSGKQYLELLDRQGYRCPICLRSVEDFTQRLSVDHDHVSGAIRGLVCSYCNRYVIGRHRDSSLLRRVADYLDQNTGWFVPKLVKKKKKK